MNRRKRLVLLTPLLLLALLMGILGWLTWWEVRHERLNQQLIAAIKREDTSAALATLEQGADANASDEKQTMPVWNIFWNGLRGKHPATSTAPTALLWIMEDEHAGSSWMNLPLIKALLAQGARVNVQDAKGCTPLFYACWDRKNATARLLIAQGARVKASEDRRDIPLADAVAYRVDADIVESMLQRGANPNVADPRDAPPLGWAVVLGKVQNIRILLRYHANPNVQLHFVGWTGTPLSYAEEYATSDPGMRQIAQMLKAAGAKK